MATKIMMKHPQTGMIKTGFYGYSWTLFCWGCLPPFFRGDFKTGLALMCTLGLAAPIYGFVYNKHYTTRLLQQGYVFAGSEGEILAAKQKLGLAA